MADKPTEVPKDLVVRALERLTSNGTVQRINDVVARHGQTGPELERLLRKLRWLEEIAATPGDTVILDQTVIHQEALEMAQRLRDRRPGATAFSDDATDSGDSESGSDDT